jgi:hypothetical protein
MIIKYIPLDDETQVYITSYLDCMFVIRPTGCFIRGLGDNGRTVGPIIPPVEPGYEAVDLVRRYDYREMRYKKWYWKMVEVGN